MLVPRPDSETVIEAAIGLLPDRARPLRMLDLGLGSGCLLLTLLHEFPQASGVGIEVSPEALAVARQNATALGMAPRATLLEGDWRRPDWTRDLGGPFDLVVSNPPYIEAGDIGGLMPEVARFEPALALDGGGRPCGLSGHCDLTQRAFGAGRNPPVRSGSRPSHCRCGSFGGRRAHPGPPLERSGWGGTSCPSPTIRGWATPRIGINFWLSRKGLGPGRYLPGPTGNHPS